LRRYRHVALVLLLGVVLTSIVFNTEQNEHQARTQAEFQSQAETFGAAIQKGIERNLEVLESIGGLYAASSKVERQDFRAFVMGPLSRHQEIQALSWNNLVKDSDRASYEAATQNDGSPSFQITERKAKGQMERAERRAEYISVAYIEPLKGNEAAVGFDVASNPTRLKALERSRDTGEMVATSRITLVQETQEQFGILILKPVYKIGTPHETVEQRRQNLSGFAVGVFRIGDMVEAALRDLPKGSFNMQLDDETAPVDERALYLHQARVSDGPADELQFRVRDKLFLRTPLEMPGRQWSLLISPTPEFLSARASWEPWGVLAGGLLITALLVGYLLSMINHATKTQTLAADVSKTNEELMSEITERKRAGEQIKSSLQEKEVLLKEIQHRVKNNLQVVSSLLNLQAGEIKDKRAREALKDSQHRVISMAMVHEKLYQSRDLARVDFHEYVQGLATELLRSYRVDSDAITLKIRPGHVSLGVDAAIPCGLIVNELISNCLKHAFPAGRKGQVLIDFHLDNDKYNLVVSDNGVGLPKDLDFRNSDTLGLQLVITLTDQIGATIELNGDGGTEFKIMFPAFQPK